MEDRRKSKPRGFEGLRSSWMHLHAIEQREHVNVTAKSLLGRNAYVMKELEVVLQRVNMYCSQREDVRVANRRKPTARYKRQGIWVHDS
jgi:hypothetical protein